MAFDGINKFIEALECEHDSLCQEEKQIEQHWGDIPKENSQRSLALVNCKKMQILYTLSLFHDTVLSHAKFRGQKVHCRSVMEKLNPSYCQGYFKGKK